MSNAVDPPSLQELTVSAFCEGAIKSAVLIDEQFPKLSDALAFDSVDSDHVELADKYPEWNVARDLYEAFHREQIVCDIENEPNKLEVLPEQITKTDLVVLDLHLSDPNDVSDSTKVLQALARDTNFNIVVVYTKHPKLKETAVGLAGSICGKNKFSDPDAEAVFPELRQEHEGLNLPIDEMAESYILGSIPSGGSIGELRGELNKNHKIKKTGQDEVIENLAAYFLQEYSKSIPDGGPRVVANAVGFDDDNPWMAFSNVFVVIADKNETKPNQILTIVKNAILKWNPSIVRTIICQIQNTIADKSYAFAESFANDIETQIAWLFHASQAREDDSRAIEMLIQRMVLSIRSHLTSDEELREFVSSCVSTLPDSVDADTQINQLCKAFDDVDIEPTDVIHALNCFESTEEFSTEFVTTGTVLFSKDGVHGARWWVCVEPACDTVPSQASSKDNFLQCRLLEVRNCTDEKDEVVKFATRSRYIFVKFDSNREFLDALNKTSDQPKPVTAFVRKENQLAKNRVSVFLPDKSNDSLGFTELEMEIVAQLQEPYANRLLQETGNQLSRIGLNFINLPDDTE